MRHSGLQLRIMAGPHLAQPIFLTLGSCTGLSIGESSPATKAFAGAEVFPSDDGASRDAVAERFHNTMLGEFYRVAFRHKIYVSVEALQHDLDDKQIGGQPPHPQAA